MMIKIRDAPIKYCPIIGWPISGTQQSADWPTPIYTKKLILLSYLFI